MRRILFLILLFANFLVAEPRLEFNQTALDDYVHSIDGSYDYEVIERVTGEGFTTYISVLAEDKILNKNSDHPLSSSYRNYNYIANSGQEQPLTTHADRYRTNMNYGIGAYSKGSVFLAQLGYIIGEENLAKTLKRYFQESSHIQRN